MNETQNPIVIAWRSGPSSISSQGLNNRMSSAVAMIPSGIPKRRIVSIESPPCPWPVVGGPVPSGLQGDIALRSRPVDTASGP